MPVPRRPWIELNEDRLVVVRLIASSEPDLTEMFMDDHKIIKRSIETPCKLVILINQGEFARTTHGVTLYERRLDHEALWNLQNIIGFVSGPDQTETMKIKIDVDWVFWPDYVPMEVSRLNGKWACMIYCVIPAITTLLGKCIRNRWIELFSGAFSGAWLTCNILYHLFRLGKCMRDQYESSRKVYQCVRRTWTLKVHPSFNDITPFLWGETMLPLCHMRKSVIRVRLCKNWFRNLPPYDDRTMPRLLCSSVSLNFKFTPKSIKTPDGTLLKEHAGRETIVLPDVRDYNIASWRRKCVQEFKEGELKKEIIQAAWHPRRVAQGIIDLDN